MTADTAVAGREKSRLKKREQILEAAATLFFEKSYRGTSMDDICAVRGVSKPFVYYHFSSKEDILLALYEASVNAALETIRGAQRATDDPLHQLKRFTHDYTMLVVRETQRIGIISRERTVLDAERMRGANAGRREFFDRLVGILSAGVHSGCFRIGNCALTAHAITGAITWTINWYHAGEKSDPNGIAKHIQTVVLRLADAGD